MVQVLKGNIVQAPALGELQITEQGYLVMEDGVIRGVYDRLPLEYATAPLVDYGQVRVVNGRQGSRSNSTKLYTIPGEPCRAPANGVVVLAAELALTGNTVVIDHGCGMRSYLYGLQTLSVSAGQTVEKGQAVGVLGEELTMDFKLGSKSVNPWMLFQTSGGLFWKENS